LINKESTGKLEKLGKLGPQNILISNHFFLNDS
jgi:hypothetical protein